DETEHPLSTCFCGSCGGGRNAPCVGGAAERARRLSAVRRNGAPPAQPLRFRIRRARRTVSTAGSPERPRRRRAASRASDREPPSRRDRGALLAIEKEPRRAPRRKRRSVVDE